MNDLVEFHLLFLCDKLSVYSCFLITSCVQGMAGVGGAGFEHRSIVHRNEREKTKTEKEEEYKQRRRMKNTNKNKINTNKKRKIITRGRSQIKPDNQNIDNKTR